MLKSFSELRKIDVTPYCDYREAKDDKGKTVKIPYLPWAKCLDLLHENGAEEVWFEPIENKDGSLLFSAAHTETEKGKKCGNYFVKVLIHIDNLEFSFTHALMNGSYVVWEDTLTQLRISNALARAFVKGVAIRTGLGFSLWLDDKDTEPTRDDLSDQNPLKLKQYIEQLMTEKIKRGATEDDILSDMGISKKQFETVLKALTNASFIINGLRK